MADGPTSTIEMIFTSPIRHWFMVLPRSPDWPNIIFSTRCRRRASKR